MMLGLLFLLFLLILFINFSVELELIVKGTELKPVVRFGVGRLLFPVPAGLLTKAGQVLRNRDVSTMEKLMKSLNTGLRILDNFLQKIKFFQLEIVLSLGNPFWTSLTVGGLWGVLGPLLTEMSASKRFDTSPKIVIEPNYGIPDFRLHLHCIFQFRIGQIIISELNRITVNSIKFSIKGVE